MLSEEFCIFLTFKTGLTPFFPKNGHFWPFLAIFWKIKIKKSEKIEILGTPDRGQQKKAFLSKKSQPLTAWQKIKNRPPCRGGSALFRKGSRPQTIGFRKSRFFEKFEAKNLRLRNLRVHFRTMKSVEKKCHFRKTWRFLPIFLGYPQKKSVFRKNMP